MRTVTTVRTLAMLVLGAAMLHATSRTSVARESTHAPTPPEVAVSIRTFQFTPDTVRVTIGARVVWTNTDDIEHTITSGTPDTRDGRFDGVVDKRGASYSAVMTKAGTYRYFCDRHRFMNGTVIVTPRGDLK